jgi:hypothetical protein
MARSLGVPPPLHFRLPATGGCPLMRILEGVVAFALADPGCILREIARIRQMQNSRA